MLHCIFEILYHIAMLSFLYDWHDSYSELKYVAFPIPMSTTPCDLDGSLHFCTEIGAGASLLSVSEYVCPNRPQSQILGNYRHYTVMTALPGFYIYYLASLSFPFFWATFCPYKTLKWCRDVTSQVKSHPTLQSPSGGAGWSSIRKGAAMHIIAFPDGASANLKSFREGLYVWICGFLKQA